MALLLCVTSVLLSIATLSWQCRNMALLLCVTSVLLSIVTLSWQMPQNEHSQAVDVHVANKWKPADPEIYMDATQLITSKGYPCENHYVTTQDGYILKMQRIPHGRTLRFTSPKEQPAVILQHGLQGSATNWLDNMANESLAYLLADAGADVWIANSRGTSYSRNHTSLSPSQQKFWEWTWDELAAYDLPALFDHVTRVTGQKQIHFVGHSQGTLIGFAGFSTNATLASMVKKFYALAPVARLANTKTDKRYLIPFSKLIEELYDLIHHGEFGQYLPKLQHRLALWCHYAAGSLCEYDLYLHGSFDWANVNKSRVPIYVAHGPEGTSVRNIIHYGQALESKAFQMYDFGSAPANRAHYGQPTPPLYHLEKMKVPVITYAGGQDPLADPEDVAWLLSQLPNLQAHHVIPEWGHLDFMFGMDALEKCYKDMIKNIFTM